MLLIIKERLLTNKEMIANFYDEIDVLKREQKETALKDALNPF